MAKPSEALDPGHLFQHVQDQPHFEVPEMMAAEGKLVLPQPLKMETPLIEADPDLHLLAFDFQLTKFMVLELFVALVMMVLFILLAKRMADGSRTRGRFWNFLEVLVVFIRNEVARPAIGKHGADKFVPFILTMFFFVLGCNLMGLVPWAGSATGALATTGTLALLTFATVVGAGSKELGVVGFWKAQVPHMELPAILAVLLIPMIFVIEVLGLCIKHFVLSVRLLANMFAGHLVLAVLLAFILATSESLIVFGVIPASVLGSTAFLLLELFVAFLQAYIFAFLTALFIGSAVHPH